LIQKSFFPGRILRKIEKPFSKRPKGLELAGSPYWKGLELLRGI